MDIILITILATAVTIVLMWPLVILIKKISEREARNEAEIHSSKKGFSAYGTSFSRDANVPQPKYRESSYIVDDSYTPSDAGASQYPGDNWRFPTPEELKYNIFLRFDRRVRFPDNYEDRIKVLYDPKYWMIDVNANHELFLEIYYPEQSAKYKREQEAKRKAEQEYRRRVDEEYDMYRDEDF